MNFDFSDNVLAYYLLTIASVRIRVPLILLLLISDSLGGVSHECYFKRAPAPLGEVKNFQWNAHANFGNSTLQDR